MRWNIILFAGVFLLFMTLIFISYARAQVTGDATQPIGVSIDVLASPATLTILNPKNHTYLTNHSLLLNFTVDAEQTIWYNLDNGTNITITSFTYFNTTEDSHILYLFVNNSDGTLTTKNVTFSIDSTVFTILYSEYNGSNRGDSNDFIRNSYEEIQNLTEIILENTQDGKVEFGSNEINLTDDSDITDNLLDLDTNTNISSNRIELNGTALPNFNVTATLSLYSLTFTTPRILRDGAVCSSTICTQQSFSGGTLIFNVTAFSIYSAEETPSDAVGGAGGGASSSGGGAGIKRFTLDKEILEVSLKQGETKKEEITIENTGTGNIIVDLEIQGLEDFIELSENSFELSPRESKTIALLFSAKEDEILDLHVGKLIVKSSGLEEEVLISLEIESGEALFDVRVKIPEKYQVVSPGKEVAANVELFNLGETGIIDLEVEYFIRNEEGETIVSEKETIAIETQANFVKTMQLPSDLEDGNYIFYVRTTYDDKVASASAWFEVIREPLLAPAFYKIILIIILIILLLIFLILFLLHRHKKHKKLSKAHEEVMKSTRK